MLKNVILLSLIQVLTVFTVLSIIGSMPFIKAAAITILLKICDTMIGIALGYILSSHKEEHNA